MLELILKYLRKRNREPILSIFDLAIVIMRRCAGLVVNEHERLPQGHDLMATFTKAVGSLVSI
jgi:hypothetical protein